MLYMIKFFKVSALYLFGGILGLITNVAFAQDKVVLSGTIKDMQSGESVIRATIRIQELPNLGVFSNEYGFYSISLSKGNYTLLVSQLGYELF